MIFQGYLNDIFGVFCPAFSGQYGEIKTVKTAYKNSG